MSRLTGWRRVANAMWSAPNDPQIYGSVEFDATRALAFLNAARAAGHRLTPTHLVGRALAHVLEKVPELNVRLVGARAVPRESIDIFFITAIEGGRDLSGVKVRHVDRRAAVEVAAELAQRAATLRTGGDRDFSRSKRVMDLLPKGMLRATLQASALLTETLQIEVPGLALHKSPFGCAMVTSVGMFGLPHGFAPLSWLYDVPLLVLVGEIAERAVVVDHQVVARPVIPICATVDHRYVDGFQLAQAVRAMRGYLEDPGTHEPPLPASPEP